MRPDEPRRQGPQAREQARVLGRFLATRLAQFLWPAEIARFKGVHGGRREAVAARANGGVEGVDAGHVPALPLLDGRRDVQRNPYVYRRVYLDDGIRQLFLLLHKGGFRDAPIRPDDVASQLPRLLRLPHPQQRVHALLHLPAAHAVYRHGVRDALAGTHTKPSKRNIPHGQNIRDAFALDANLGRPRCFRHAIGTPNSAFEIFGRPLPGQSRCFV
mmetsp:Transcript_24248/g.61447  ORF Transcript_24248/g.61447 Transcript_24248/m.61447 type:complete len:216 (+) Transcript_24248:442-1089(+)